MEKRIERTTADGRRYMFVETFPHFISTYAWYDNKFNHICKDFRTFEEAEAWVRKFDEPVKESRYIETIIPDDYYGVRGRYYGD